jgi:hypothetical protein
MNMLTFLGLINKALYKENYIEIFFYRPATVTGKGERKTKLFVPSLLRFVFLASCLPPMGQVQFGSYEDSVPVLPSGRNFGRKAQKGPTKIWRGRKSKGPNFCRIDQKRAEKGPNFF